MSIHTRKKIKNQITRKIQSFLVDKNPHAVLKLRPVRVPLSETDNYEIGAFPVRTARQLFKIKHEHVKKLSNCTRVKTTKI